jgi:uncharacterized membrane protein YraQ (UPF0718 family)
MKSFQMMVKRYRMLLSMLLILFVLHFFYPSLVKNASLSALDSLKEMLTLLPPIFILLGLLDVWAPKEVMMRYLGEEAGLKGIIISYLFGAVAAGPLYAAFPVAVVLIRKGCSYRNLMIFMGAWSTIKVPMLLYEMSSLGFRFTFTRLGLNIIGIFVVAQIMNAIIDQTTKDELVERATKL